MVGATKHRVLILWEQSKYSQQAWGQATEAAQWASGQGWRQGQGLALHVSSTWQSSVTFHCKNSSK